MEILRKDAVRGRCPDEMFPFFRKSAAAAAFFYYIHSCGIVEYQWEAGYESRHL